MGGAGGEGAAAMLAGIARAMRACHTSAQTLFFLVTILRILPCFHAGAHACGRSCAYIRMCVCAYPRVLPRIRLASQCH